MTKKQPILIVGKSGQLAQAIAHVHKGETDLVFLGSAEHDFFNDQATATLLDELQPAYVINTAAYTQVDKAESDTDAAFKLNAELPKILAEVTAQLNIPLIHVSTDYVFDGQAKGTYTPNDATNPINVYGQSKLAGEQAVQAAGGTHVIVRTSWVISRFGNNFAKTMVRLMQERDELGIVADQFGTPTSAVDLAEFLLGLGDNLLAEQSTTLHFSSAPKQSWFNLAQSIHTTVSKVKAVNCKLNPITTADYPTPAKRAKNTALESIVSPDQLHDSFQQELQAICRS